MLKRFTALLLVATLVCSSFQWVMVCAGFQLNRSYIAANLCVNRNKPWMHCNGKCYFMQKLKQAQENEKRQAERDNLHHIEVFFLQQKFNFDFLSFNPEPQLITHCDNYSCLYTNQYISSLFRPPRFAA